MNVRNAVKGLLFSALALCIVYFIFNIIWYHASSKQSVIAPLPSSVTSSLLPEEADKANKTLQEASTLQLYTSVVSFIPGCKYKHEPTFIEDFTHVFQSQAGLQGRCLSNPSVIALDSSGSHLLVSFRMYSSWEKSVSCTQPDKPGGQWQEGWKGKGGLGLAVMRRRGPGMVELLAENYESPSSREDARLFRDNHGVIRLLYNRWRGGDVSMQGFKRNQRRSMHVSEVTLSQDFQSIELKNEQELIYIHQQMDEKNWVPWEGSVMMTYPQFPDFEPHVVMEWNSYDSPQDSLEFKSVTSIPFMQRFRSYTGGWIRFSGGTPGVRLDKDRFIAVGHSVGDLTCYHQQITSGRRRKRQRMPWAAGHRKGMMSSAKATVADDDTRSSTSESSSNWALRADVEPHACDASLPAPVNSSAWQQHFKDYRHFLPLHHPYWEYFFFLYTWNSEPPHALTHISHAFIPWDAQHHRGVYFPTGLDRLRGTFSSSVASTDNKQEPPSSLILTYGKDDNKLMALNLGAELLEEWLIPISNLSPEHYKFCSLAPEISTMTMLKVN
ncbi:hypothetical protein CEUSTIGMA_g5371.t1 [Chlamydomonas eustigma]|uniref:Uncharacterized protein n=1 Tax=Chlamydomonas eustigma TaxID=1157962 RepID=A0A250X4T7_9CHLO|nr:hypothetical protein CEUSTIGMA_g5371.t1 [Chlamydomonas eustigma]|eukprot:GAX77929.1 hypothetical protein CEUSTIGMA_g5371.t1 [Chlamydomonas eustigma]